VIVQHLHLRGSVLVGCGRPQLHGAVRIGKPRRHNADDGVRPGIEENRLAQNRDIAAETALPEVPAKEGRSIRGGTVVGRGEVATQGRLDAEYREH